MKLSTERVIQHVQERLNPRELLLVNSICSMFGITLQQFFGKKSSARVIAYRNLFYKILREAGYSCKDIAYVGGKNHSTIVYHLKKSVPENLVTSFAELKETYFTQWPIKS